MRFHSVTLRNYRGIEDRKVELGLTGVTVIEGPNEIGKSSLAEALNLIFEYPDSTKTKKVNSVKTVGRDAGPEIEVEAEIGPHRLVYRKRFLKKAETVLTITQPRLENLTGRDAHDRVQELLKEHVDAELWRALCVMQGGGIEPTDLANATSLAEALDHAAGGEVSGDRERSIFDAVHEEFNKYYTDGEVPRRPLVEAADELAKAQTAVSELESELISVDKLIQDSARLDTEITDLKQQVDEAKKTVAARDDEERDLAQQEEKLAQLDLESRQSAELQQRADKDFAARQGLVDRVGQSEKAEAELLDKQSKDSPAVLDAETAGSDARRELETAGQDAANAAQLTALRAADADYHSNRLDLVLLDERRQQIVGEQSKKDAATELLSHCSLDNKLLERLRKAQGELIRTEALLNAGSPKLRVTALGHISLELGAEVQELPAGSSLEEIVREKTKLVIPSVAEIEVTAGTSLDELIRSHDKSQKTLTDLLLQACVPDLEAAEKASLEYRDARNCIESAGKAIETALRDLTFEQMLSKIGRLKASTEGYPTTRVVDPPLPDSLESAKAALRAAQALKDEADRKQRAANAKHEATKGILGDMRLIAAQVGGQLIEVRSQLETLRQELAIARGNKSDVSLAQDLDSAAKLAAAAKTIWETARQDLQAKDPQRIRELAQNARKAADRMATELREKEKNRDETLMRLDLLGTKGLFEHLEQARTRLEHASRQDNTVKQRAAAAQLLFGTMKHKREEARRAYAAPLSEKIVQLGKYLFDSSFDVELDDKLAIVSRSLQGLTLPFDSLSVGTQEQLGLIVRLACSLLVDQQQGVPLIFDDTLGHSDPQRLEGMGAMLNHAGQRCQIVILTCTPGRFRHIGNAKTISLRDGSSTTPRRRSRD